MSELLKNVVALRRRRGRRRACGAPGRDPSRERRPGRGALWRLCRGGAATEGAGEEREPPTRSGSALAGARLGEVGVGEKDERGKREISEKGRKKIEDERHVVP